NTAALLASQSIDVLSISRFHETDWVERSGLELPPVSIGPLTLVDGDRHARPDHRPRRFVLDVPSSTAFGTGHHPTTALCLEAIGALARRGPLKRALDLGTGTGILAMAIARLTPAHIIASDSDPQSVTTARSILRRNSLAHRISLIAATGFAHPHIGRFAPYPLVVANILAAPLRALCQDLAKATARGGTLILSGLLEGQAPDIAARYRARGLILAHTLTADGWAALVFRRP
ncbi:MAG: 50S ribosomal protein L11 methyltransferase, partial [Pseudomonadota bacterium]